MGTVEDERQPTIPHHLGVRDQEGKAPLVKLRVLFYECLNCGFIGLEEGLLFVKLRLFALLKTKPSIGGDQVDDLRVYPGPFVDLDQVRDILFI